jgi:hypothetical protein
MELRSDPPLLGLSQQNTSCAKAAELRLNPDSGDFQNADAFWCLYEQANRFRLQRSQSASGFTVTHITETILEPTETPRVQIRQEGKN